MKVAKRLKQILDSMPSIDLLRLVDPRRDAAKGQWRFEGNALVCQPGDAPAILQIPCWNTPSSYRIEMDVERTQGQDFLTLGLLHGEAQFAVLIGGTLPGVGRGFCGVGFDSRQSLDDGRNWIPNDLMTSGKFLVEGKPHTLACTVAEGMVHLESDGQPVFKYSPDWKLLAMPTHWKTPTKSIFIGSWKSGFKITKMKLISLR